MPRIEIRLHGLSASRQETLIDPETGEVVKLSYTPPPRSGGNRGWTREVARRNEKRLQEIDFDAIDGSPVFVTLTMPSSQMNDVSAAMFHAWLRAWLMYARRHGMRHYFWILEFQASGNPHLHVIVWVDPLPDAVAAFGWLRAWVRILNRSGVLARIQGQCWEPIDVGGDVMVDGELVPAHPERVLMYLAKHAVRGVAHYQRRLDNMPEGWERSSGRVWGHDRGLPLRESERVEVDYRTFHRFRRLVRAWRLAEARRIRDDGRRRKAIVRAWHMLKWANRAESPYRGVSAWIPATVASGLLEAAMRMAGEVEDEESEG